MKNQWPFWLFLVVIIIVIIFSMNYQKKAQPVHLGEIFEEGSSRKIDYIYKPDENIAIQTPPQQPPVPAVTPEVKPSAAVVAVEPQPVVKPPVQEVVMPKPPQSSEQAAGQYVIQILASKDKSSTDKALDRARKNGFSAAYIQTVELGEKGTWYRIYIGGFKTKAEADGALANVKASYKDAFIRALK